MWPPPDVPSLYVITRCGRLDTYNACRYDRCDRFCLLAPAVATYFMWPPPALSSLYVIALCDRIYTDNACRNDIILFAVRGCSSIQMLCATPVTRRLLRTSAVCASRVVDQLPEATQTRILSQHVSPRHKPNLAHAKKTLEVKHIWHVIWMFAKNP